jgi:hypothetical protein
MDLVAWGMGLCIVSLLLLLLVLIKIYESNFLFETFLPSLFSSVVKKSVLVCIWPSCAIHFSFSCFFGVKSPKTVEKGRIWKMQTFMAPFSLG